MLSTQNGRSAATIIAGNEDILIEILLYVPTKSLIRFKSVSKSWFFLISSSHFSRLHTFRHRSTTKYALCLRKPPSTHYLMPLKQQTDPPKIRTLHFKLSPNSNNNTNPTPTQFITKILQSCNGLVLLEVFPIHQDALKEYYVYNPATHQSRLLPLNSPSQSSCNNGENKNRSTSRVLGLSLAYDPSKSVQYKVVCVKFATFSVYSYEIEVYESETHCWKLANGGKGVVMPYDLRFSDGVYWNGNIHWIRPRGDSFYFNLDNDCVVQWPAIPTQTGFWNGGGSLYYFGNSNGHLQYVTMYKNPCPGAIWRVFEMENDCSRWFLKYQVNLKDILCEFPEIKKIASKRRWSIIGSYALCFLGLIREENEEDSIMVFHVPGKVVAYKFKDGNFVELADLRTADIYREGCLQFGYGDAHIFAQTLASV